MPLSRRRRRYCYGAPSHFAAERRCRYRCRFMSFGCPHEHISRRVSLPFVAAMPPRLRRDARLPRAPAAIIIERRHSSPAREPPFIFAHARRLPFFIRIFHSLTSSARHLAPLFSMNMMAAFPSQYYLLPFHARDALPCRLPRADAEPVAERY